MRNYELYEFDNDKVFTKEINIYDVKQIEGVLIKPYETNSKGTTIIDKNKDLTNSRNLISLVTTKMSTIRFNQVIDINFEDFVDPPVT
jgi:hypothetical protein